MSINQITVMGNLGDDPKMTVFDDGNKVVRLKIATNSSWKDKNTGEKREDTEWHTAYLRNRLAEVAQEYLKKGDKVYISGKMRSRKYINEKEETHWITEIHGKKMLMVSTGRSHKDKAGYAEQPVSASIDTRDHKLTTNQGDLNNNLGAIDSNPVIENGGLADQKDQVANNQSADGVKIDGKGTLVEKEMASNGNEQPSIEEGTPVVEEGREIENRLDGSTSEDNVDSPTAVSNENATNTEEVDDLDIEIDCSEDITDEFNRKALEASEQDDKTDIGDLPSWLIP